jgi:hypothetical protein
MCGVAPNKQKIEHALEMSPLLRCRARRVGFVPISLFIRSDLENALRVPGVIKLTCRAQSTYKGALYGGSVFNPMKHNHLYYQQMMF